jgi:hypothetical protein
VTGFGAREPWSRPAPRARRAIRREIALVLLFGVLPIFLLGAFTYPPCAEEPPSPFPYIELSTPVHVALVIYAYISFVVAPVVAMARAGKPLSHWGFSWHGRGDVWAGLAAAFANYVAGWIIWWAYWATSFPLGVESIRAFHYIHASTLGEMLATWPWYVLVVFAEELMARCYLITRLRDLTGSIPMAIIGSATLYALWHLFWGWAGAFHVFVAGLIFGALFTVCRGWGAPAFGHWLFDALTLLPR